VSLLAVAILDVAFQHLVSGASGLVALIHNYRHTPEKRMHGSLTEKAW
jgi:hypothetical protein